MGKLVLVTHGISILVRNFEHISVVYVLLTRGKSTNNLDIALSSSKLKCIFLIFLSQILEEEKEKQEQQHQVQLSELMDKQAKEVQRLG